MIIIKEDSHPDPFQRTVWRLPGSQKTAPWSFPRTPARCRWPQSFHFPPRETLQLMITASQLKWIFLSLVTLRLIIGYHFFTEGQAKLEQGSGQWSAAPFFAAAKGPLAPYFRGLLPDWNHLETLCVVRRAPGKSQDPAPVERGLRRVANQQDGAAASGGQTRTEASREVVELDPALTFGRWQIFVEDVLLGYRLRQQELAARIAANERNMAELNEAIEQGRSGQTVNVSELLRRRDQLAAFQQRLQDADPLPALLAIIKRRQDQLTDYLETPVVRDEILKSVADEDRLRGSLRDGASRSRAATQVDSLRGHVTKISSDIQAARWEHAQAIRGIWYGLEEELNAYGASLTSPVERDVDLVRKVSLEKPFESHPGMMLYWIDRVVPYFDLTVGILLLIGLFSRVASLAGAGFLLGIIATQPIWVPGHDPKIIWNMVEFGGLLVLAATVAGRFGGLDYFLYRLFRRPKESGTLHS
jgi:uncharacterized membrane protein YphA (DoxX/SURF4 family)